jgi:hypothetical protein
MQEQKILSARQYCKDGSTDWWWMVMHEVFNFMTHVMCTCTVVCSIPVAVQCGFVGKRL